MKILAPSLLSADFSCLAEELAKIEKAGAQYIHLDIMDGHFVPNITFGAPVVKKLRPVSGLVFDVHLMIEHPERFLADFAKAGADILNVHAETCKDLPKILQTIRSMGISPAVTVKPKTPVAEIAAVLPLVDMVLVMTVEPGFGGQSLIPACLDKVKELRDLRKTQGLAYRIQVDGGVTLENARQILDCGADILVAGSAVFGAGDVSAAAEAFLKIFDEQ